MARFVRWLVIGPAALAGLVAIVAGGPILLLKLGGNPLPDHLLSPSELADLLTQPDDGRLLLWALSVVGWGAWAVVAGSVLLELGAQLTGRRTPNVPGLAGPQRLASLLVAGVLAALTSPGLTHAHAAYLDQPVAAAEYRPPPADPPSPPPVPVPVAYAQADPEQTEADQEPLVHEVAKGDWMWHIAGRYLGDEERYPEIAALNPELAERYADYPDHIQPGDQLVLPPDAYDRGERPHATGELLNDEDPEQPESPGEPPEPQPAEPALPDGSAEPEPEPEPAPPPEAAAPETATPETTAPETTAPETEAPETEAPETAEPVVPPPATVPSEPTATAPPEPTGSEPVAPAPPQEAAPPLPPAAGNAGPDDLDSDLADDDSELGPAMLVCAGVLASVLVGALLVYRVRKLARRRYRRTLTGAAHAETEATLRAAATTDVARLDQALRVLSAALAADPEGPRRLPDIGAVWIGEGEIHLILTTPTSVEPPPPFYATGSGSWFLPADAPLPDVAGAVAPLPALVTIGSQPGQHLLIDLERMGMLTITGNQQRCGDLLRYLVAELAHNPWSDRVEVTLAGFPPDTAESLARLNPDRIVVAGSLPEAAEALRRRLRHTTAALDAHGLADSVHGRISDTASDTWIPHLLLIHRPRPEHDQLLADLETALTEAGRRCAVAVATTAPTGVRYGRRSITITDDGLLKAGFLHDSHPMPAVALPEHLLAPLADLLRDAAEGEDYPIPPAIEPWAGDTDLTGSILLPEPSAPIEPAIGRYRLTNGLNQPGSTGLDQPPAGLEPPAGPGQPPAAEPEPPAASRNGGAFQVGTPVQLPIIGPAVYEDPDLDQSVEAWLAGSDQAPRISLLGPIQVTAAGPPPPARVRVCRELIVYLVACGDRGADPGEIDRQLWPGQRVSPTLRTEVIANARRWLGNGPDGEPWLPEAGIDGRYRLRDGILVDWHLFRRLRTRGERRGLAGAEDLRNALQLIRGAPLADAHELATAGTRVPYSWLAGSVIEPDLILAGILDTAHELVSLCLTTGDLATARWAVDQAWRADVHRADDHPWRDLLRIARAQGDHDEVRDIVAELLRWRDAEHPDELTPETQRLITSLVANQPTGAGGRR
ncbi:MAG TPA: hypothetical protein VIL37_13090 [Natronosporangium sp.]